MRTATAVILLATVVRASTADAQDKPSAPPKPPTPGQAADAVLAAAAAKDDAKLAALAAARVPDPWLVADELLLRGKADEALAFAKAAPRVDIEKLPEFLESRRSKSPDAAARKALAAADSAIAARRWPDALAAVDAAKPADDPVVSILLESGRGAALRGSARLDESAAAFDRAAVSAEALGWLARASIALQECGVSSFNRGDLPAARDSWTRRLAIETRRGWKAGIAATLGNLGAVHIRLGDPVKALECTEQSLRLNEELQNTSGAASALNELGNIHKSLSEYREALDCHERALELYRRLQNRAGVATALGNVGVDRQSLGDFAKALEFHQEALKEKLALDQKSSAAMTMRSIGNAYQSLGDYPKALDWQERALATARDAGDRATEANALGGIGLVHDALGDYAKALEFEQRALALQETIGDRVGYALTLGNIGNLHDELGAHDKALEFQKRALEQKEQLGDRVGCAHTLTKLAEIHKELGRFDEALACAQKALAIETDIGAREQETATLGMIAQIHGARGDVAKALEFADRSLRRAEEIGELAGEVQALWTRMLAECDAKRPRDAVATGRDAVGRMAGLVRGQSDETGAAARGQFADVFDLGAAAAADAGDVDAACFFLESGRAGALLESLKIRGHVVESSIPPALVVAERDARAKESAAAGALRRARADADPAAVTKARGELAAAQAAVLDAVGRIQREAKAAAGVEYPKPDDLPVIRARLAPSEALVLYGVCNKGVLALVVTSKDARVVQAAPTDDVRKACAALALDKPDADPAAALEALRKLVVEPLKLGADVKRVFVSPDAELCFVPFALLAPGLEVVYEPSATVYGLLYLDASKKGDGVLALGDPDYGAKPAPEAAARARSAFDLSPLPGTRAEATAVGTTTLLAKDATETRLAEELAKKPRWRAVHLACHGLIDAENPGRSALAVTPDAQSDGFLSVVDVFRMKCPADLVALSACETGKGKVVRGEGLIGLTRAFMFAGAPRVIVSLWKVDDEATRALMTKFYERWNPAGDKGVGAAQALREAQAFVASQEKWKHPRYWAAWVLWGLAE